MAASDATPFPVKNQAYRVTFPILDADGDLVTAAGALDSEVSKDGGTFADCTNEATEIATSSGMYYLDLTATEMNADTVSIIVKSTNGKTTPLVLYPQADGLDRNVNVTHWSGAAVATPDTAGYPKTTIKDGTGAGEIALTGGAIDSVTLCATVTTLTGHTAQTGDSFARLGAPAGASVSADIATVDTGVDAVKVKTDFLPSATAGAAGGVFIAGTNAATTITTGLTTTFTGNLTGSVGSVTGAVGSVTGSVASVTGAVGSVTGNVGGNVTGSVGSLATQAKTDVNTEVVDALSTDTYAELADVPAATVSLADKISWLFMLARNKVTQSATTQTLRNDADSADIGTSTVSDSAGTFTRGEWTDSP